MPSSPASIRTRLAGGQPLVATFSLVDSIEVVEAAMIAGFDTVVIDLEHGAASLDSLRQRLLAVAAHGAEAIVRVPRLDAVTIGVVLDAGAAQVLVPHVASADDARAAVAATFFTPIGERGANPFVRAADFHGDADWFERENRRVGVMAMIEGAQALDEIDAILAVEHLGAAFLGPFDLSHALGVPGQVEHPAVIAAIEHILDACAATGVASGVFAPSPELADRWLDRGANLVVLGVDARWIRAGLASAREGVRSAPISRSPAG